MSKRKKTTGLKDKFSVVVGMRGTAIQKVSFKTPEDAVKCAAEWRELGAVAVVQDGFRPFSKEEEAKYLK